MSVDEALAYWQKNYVDPNVNFGEASIDNDVRALEALVTEVKRLRGENVRHKSDADYHAQRSVKLAKEVDVLRAELDRYCGECGGCDAHFKGCTNTEDVTSADGSSDGSGTPGA